MFPPLRETGVSDDIEVVGLASKETPLYEVETVAGDRAPFGSSDMFIDSSEDKDNHSGTREVMIIESTAMALMGHLFV